MNALQDYHFNRLLVKLNLQEVKALKVRRHSAKENLVLNVVFRALL